MESERPSTEQVVAFLRVVVATRVEQVSPNMAVDYTCKLR